MSKRNDAPQPELLFLTEARVKKILHYEQSFQKLCGKIDPELVRARKRCAVSPEDLLLLIEKRQTVPEEVFSTEWALPVMKAKHALFLLDDDEADGTVDGYHGLPTEERMCAGVFEAFLNSVVEGEWDPDFYRDAVRRILDMRTQAVPLRAYSDAEKLGYLQYFMQGKRLEEAENREILLFVLYTDELCGRKVLPAMDVKAFSCYGGNRAYPCSWEKSAELFTELLNLTGNPVYANALGYIYYYGRTTKGRPQFDKSFYYFSIGAAGGIIESQYKIADQFLGGYGVPKNPGIAYNRVLELYGLTIRQMQEELFESKFADIALRMGSFFRSGTVVPQDADRAAYFLLQAAFAIRERRRFFDLIGDDQVEEKIRLSLQTVLPHSSFPAAQKEVAMEPFPLLSQTPYNRDTVFQLKLKEEKKGIYSGSLSRKDGRLFITVLPAHFCGLVKEIVFRAVRKGRWILPREAEKDGLIRIRFNEVRDDGLYLDGERIAKISADWTIRMDKTK